MLIETGRETDDGTFQCRVVGESHEGETAAQAIKRVAEQYLEVSLDGKKHEWRDWGRLGPHENPTEYLPALFVGRRLFTIRTRWQNGAWVLA